jgi:hypothetical protein
MRVLFVAAVWALCMMGVAMAQTEAGTSVPREIGNRANGFDFQPTPSEVLPREESAGLRQSETEQSATDRDLATIDRSLLRKEGLSEQNVPKFKLGQ